MKLIVKAKQVGRKNTFIDRREIEISGIGETPSLRDFLCEVVRQQVEEFNSKTKEKSLLNIFSNESEIIQNAEAGKVSFGRVYNKEKVDISAAQQNALLAFEDGLFSVFIGDEEIEDLEDEVDLKDLAEITFIRLTFLAGSYW